MIDWSKKMIVAATVEGSFSIVGDCQSLNTTHELYDNANHATSLYPCIFIRKMATVKYPNLTSSEDYK